MSASAIAASNQSAGHVACLGWCLRSRRCAAPIEVGADADVVDADALHDVVDVIQVVVEIRPRHWTRAPAFGIAARRAFKRSALSSTP